MTFNKDILRIIDGLKSPSFIVDREGKILHSNSEAKALEYHNAKSFIELFMPESSAVVKLKLSESLSSLKSVEIKKALIQRSLEEEQETGVSITSFESDEGLALAVCTVYLSPGRRENEKFEFSFSSKDFKEIVKSEDIIKVFEEVKSSFPFTFLGKSRIQNEVNKLDEFFYLKDTEGRYILVNMLFAQFLGLKPNEAEGRFEKDFLPGHLSETLISLDRQLKETAKAVIRNGFPLYQLDGEKARVIEIPLCDLDNNVIAVLGVTQKNYSETPEVINSSELLERILALFPGMVILADKEGKVKYKSGEIAGIKSLDIHPEMPLDGCLPAGLNFEAEKFIQGGQDRLKIRKDIPSQGAKVIPFVFHFRKIYNYKGELEGFLVFAQEEDDDFGKTGISNTIGNKEKMYEILMQTSPEPMFIYDIENLRFLDVNQAALQTYGYSRHEFLQMDLTDLYAPEDIQTLLDSSNSRNKEGVFTGPWRHRKKDGSSLLVEISKSTFDYEGKKAHFNIVKDVTQKAELEKNSQFFNAAFNIVTDPIFITDSEGFITKVNDAVTNALGYSRAELDMRPFITLAADSFRAEINTSVFYSKSKKPVSLNVELKKSDGSIVEANINANPVFDYDEQISSFNVVVKTKQKSEGASETTASRESAMGVQNAPNKPQGSIDPGFLSSMFHEILTPMNVILGFIQELTENIESPTMEQKESIDIINQNRTLLMQTMDSVLEYSHIEQNRVEITPEKVFFTEVVDDLQKNIGRIMAENKITFNYGKISTSLNFETDRHRMESFLEMFIKMVMRITKEGSIFLSAYQYDDKFCLISLKDRRSSISPYLLENISELFSAEENSIKKDFGISKLTIRLVRRLMKLLMGKVEVVKRSGEASEFGFLFPLLYRKEEVRSAEGSGLTEETLRKPEPAAKVNSKEYVSETSSLKEEEMDIIEEGEITGNLEEALKEEVPPVKMPGSDAASLPRESSSISKEQSAAPKFDLASLQCLYVEDQIDSQILFKVQMKDLKKVDSVVSFEDAMPLLKSNNYDFIIMDINLQGEYNGLDALRIIRRMPGYKNVPVIAVTAYILAGDKEKFIAAGFSGFISKPVMRDKVVEALKILI